MCHLCLTTLDKRALSADPWAMTLFPVLAHADPALLLTLAPPMARAASGIPRPVLAASLPLPIIRDIPPATTKAMP